MPTEISPHDIVADRDGVQAGAREPLILLDSLCRFLDDQGLGSGKPEFSPIGDGHSNVTLSVERGGRRFILRRPPRGPLPPSAHNVLREARIISALRGRARVPRVLAVADDASLIGAPFFLMEYVEGHVLDDKVPVRFDNPAGRHRIGTEVIDALVEIHRVDWRAAGLSSLAPPTGYLTRQLRRFGALWQRNRTRELPGVERVGAWLERYMPSSPRTTLVHGDFRLGNVIFGTEAPGHLAAVLDWEMSTLGDPLADVGYLSTQWRNHDDPPLAEFGSAPVTRELGFSSRDELIARYEELSGRRMDDLRWYQTLALWKSTVFMEGNYRRALAGTTDDPGLADLGGTVERMAGRAMALAGLVINEET